MPRDAAARAHRDPTVRLFLSAMVAVALLSNLPLLASRGLFADDWTWFHLQSTEGFRAVLAAAIAMAHGLYGPWWALVLAAGEWAGPVARSAAVALHLLNACLLFLVLRRPVLTRRVAPLAIAVFLVSPFYAARGMLAHSQYDLFLTAWLLSVIWMSARSRARRFATPFLMVLAMGLEPIMLLEPLRALFAWQNERRPATLARRLAPFWAVAAAAALLRFTWLAPSGHYAGVRRLSLAPGPLLENLGLSFVHVPASIALAGWEALHALPWLALAAVVAAAAATCWRGLGGTPPAPRSARSVGGALALAVALIGLGALPYALTGDHAWPTRFESRFFFVADVGAAIGVAAAIAALPRAAWRRAAAWATLTLFALAQLGDGKWLLLDERIQSALQRELLPDLLDPAAPKLVRLEIRPASNRHLYRFRCLGGPELNVAADLLRPPGAARSFTYETLCGEWDRLAPAACTVTQLDRFPCPVAREDRVFAIPGDLIWPRATWHAVAATTITERPLSCTPAEAAVVGILNVPAPRHRCP